MIININEIVGTVKSMKRKAEEVERVIKKIVASKEDAVDFEVKNTIKRNLAFTFEYNDEYLQGSIPIREIYEEYASNECAGEKELVEIIKRKIKEETKEKIKEEMK